MPRPKPYQYPLRPHAAPEYSYGQTVIRTGEKEVLTGIVQGMKASDLEERVARALGRLEIPFQFRARISSAALGQRRLTTKFANIRGEIEVDMLCQRDGLVTPIFVDGQIAHYFTPYQAEVDKTKTDATNEFGARLGWKPSVRLPFWRLTSQDLADRTVRNIFT